MHDSETITKSTFATQAAIGAGAGPTGKVTVTGSLGLDATIASATVTLNLVVIDTQPTATCSIGAGFLGTIQAPRGMLTGNIKLQYSQKALGGSVSLTVSFLWWSWSWKIYEWAGIAYEKTLLEYGVTKEGVSKIYDIRPKFAIGKDNYDSCQSGNECASKTCSYANKAGSTMKCRPNRGFKQGSGCYKSEDCSLGNGDYCKDGKCIALTVEYGKCWNNNECLTKECMYSAAQGLTDGCSSDTGSAYPACRCKANGGWKQGTPSYKEYRCKTNAVTFDYGSSNRRRGLWKCTRL